MAKAHSMRHLMLDRELIRSPDYARRSCVLVRYRLPLLKHCFVLCDESGEATSPGLLPFFFQQASRLAEETLGDPNAFVFIQSGASIRRRKGTHAHVFVVNRRTQKAWLYFILTLKNFGLVFASWI